MITAKVGSIRVVGQEMLQEGGEVVAMPQYQVGTEHMLVHEAQVEVIAEGVYVHQITDLVTLLSEQQGQLGRNSRVRVWEHWLPNPYFLLPGQRRRLALLPVAAGLAELLSQHSFYGEPSSYTLQHGLDFPAYLEPGPLGR